MIAPPLRLAPSAEPPPSPPSGDELHVVPLGGLGEIGMNCLALEQEDGLVVIDCGITFPDEDLGVDTYHPDLSYLFHGGRRIHGVFLTHGHEDHVGALPYLLERLGVPVWGPPYALAIARRRLEARGLEPARFQLCPASPGARYRVGPFEIEPVRVTHSIPDSTALAIRTRAGTVVHSGDFRFDPTPLDGEPTDEARLGALGDAGVRLLLSDSTNVDAEGPHASETDVGRTLERLIGGAPRRAVVGLFASNVQRLGALGEVSRRLGRKIVLLGASVERHVAWGHEVGRLSWPSDLLVPKARAAEVAPERLLVIAGGTQAEPGSSLARLASATHPSLTLEPGDTVVLSSRVIPGNDEPVLAMIAELLRRKVSVKSWLTDPLVHTSGHAHRNEQRRMLELLRPRAFIPIHGTRHHLERHAELARAAGIADALVVENGEIAALGAGRALELRGRFAAGRVATWEGATIEAQVLTERRALARGGALAVTLLLDRRGRLVAPPRASSRGVAAGAAEEVMLRAVAIEVASAVDAAPEGADEGSLAELARTAARRAAGSQTGRKPLCSVTIVRADP